ncbi:vWA domain-containing protein [Streptomyces platensis]|uniref:vWA domain-containing protein n=1 Tax=Streptomyces platensis TaxID=58346 RepID=UPI001F41C4D7|nr:VWA domain-containing protein [Streptomyces platensis]MCF3143576.1 VWA domain-containing protein [Streptomyces platensis]
MGIRSLLRNAFGRSKATREETGAAPSGADKPESATIPEAREESTPAPATPEAEVPAARTAPTETPAADPAPTTPTLPAQGSRVDRTERAEQAVESSPVREPAAAAEEPAASEEPAGRDVTEVREEPAADDATTAAAASVSGEDEAIEAVEAAEPVVAVEAVEEPAAEAAGETTAAEATSDSAEGTAEPAVAAGSSDKDEPAADVAPATATEPATATDSATGDTVADLVSQAFDSPGAAATAEAEPEAETAEAKAEPEVAEAKADVVTEPEAEPAAKAEPAADAVEPEPEVAAEPKNEPKDEPKAAAPKTEAPKTEAPKTAEPQPAAPKADQPATDEPEPAAVTSAAAASLPTTAPALVSLYKAAGSTLEKHGLATQRAAVYLVLDRSGSMRPYYKDGTVQNLAEQALGLSAHLDDDATVPVIFFSTDIDGTADLDLANYEGRIEELHAGLGHMGRTNYHWAINAVVDHYKKSGATAPAFVIFQTDGAPTSKPAAEKALCEAAGLPIFWQFIGFGDPDAKGFDFLRKLDDLGVPEKRTVDNAGFFHAGRDPRSLSHDELYQQLMVEFPEWLTEARAAGVLKDS